MRCRGSRDECLIGFGGFIGIGSFCTGSGDDTNFGLYASGAASEDVSDGADEAAADVVESDGKRPFPHFVWWGNGRFAFIDNEGGGLDGRSPAQTSFLRQQRRLHPAANLQLLQNIRHVMLDRLLCQM